MYNNVIISIFISILQTEKIMHMEETTSIT